MEIYFFWKGSAKQIIKKYQHTFGNPVLPPLWALGWQVGSKPYKTQQDLENMIASYKNSGIPLEGIWLDQDALSTNQDFKLNETSFPDLQKLSQDLKA